MFLSSRNQLLLVLLPTTAGSSGAASTSTGHGSHRCCQFRYLRNSTLSYQLADSTSRTTLSRGYSNICIKNTSSPGTEHRLMGRERRSDSHEEVRQPLDASDRLRVTLHTLAPSRSGLIRANDSWSFCLRNYFST